MLAWPRRAIRRRAGSRKRSRPRARRLPQVTKNPTGASPPEGATEGPVTGILLLEEWGAFFGRAARRETRAFLRTLTKSPPGRAAAPLRCRGPRPRNFWYTRRKRARAAPPSTARARPLFPQATFSQTPPRREDFRINFAAGLLRRGATPCIGDVDSYSKARASGRVRFSPGDPASRAAAEAPSALAAKWKRRERCAKVARSMSI